VEINLDSAVVPIRERRLGSVSGYVGTANDLVERAAAGTLAERGRTFTQCLSCSEMCAVSLLAYIQDAAVVSHAPLGCAASFGGMNQLNRWGQFKRGLPVGNAHLVSSNITESDTIFGASAKLERAVRVAYERFAPKAIFVATACASAIIGEDLDGPVDDLERELGIPIVAVHCEGFRSQLWSSGFDSAYHAILRKIVKPPARRRKMVNVVNFWHDDVFSDLLNPLGLSANLIVPFSTIAQLETISEAAATVQMCATLGTYLASGLEELHGVPAIKAPQPYGISGTDAWLRALGRATGTESAVETLIAEQKAGIAAELAELRAELKGRTAYVAAGSAHGHSLISVLRELGVTIKGGCFYHHDARFDHGDLAGDTLRHVVNAYGDFKVGVCNKQVFELVNLVRRIKPDILIVRHGNLAVWGAKLGIPTFLLQDEHLSLGYRGLVRYGRKVLDFVNNPALVKHLSRHTRLPYTQWWLEQDPYAFLKPERAD
jgi:nitrogenase molybdenum-iron protein alpha chain